MARFKLREGAGAHTQTDPDGVERTYAAGAVVESDKDLAAAMPEKFAPLVDPDSPDAQKLRAKRRQERDELIARTKASSLPPGERAPAPAGADDALRVRGWQPTGRGVNPPPAPTPEHPDPPGSVHQGPPPGVAPGPLATPTSLGQSGQVRGPAGPVASVPPGVPSAPANRAGQPVLSRHELEGMTVNELRALASREDIDLAGARTKDDIVDAILEAQQDND